MRECAIKDSTWYKLCILKKKKEKDNNMHTPFTQVPFSCQKSGAFKNPSKNSKAITHLTNATHITFLSSFSICLSLSFSVASDKERW